MDSLIFDTSAILNFGQRDDLTPLLPLLATRYRLCTTAAVVAELTDPKFRAFHDALVTAHFTLPVQSAFPSDAATLAELSAVLGPGETSVLMLANALNGIAVLDEKAARRHAASLAISFTGTLGLMREALDHGWLTDEDCLDKVTLLKQRGFRIHAPTLGQSFAEFVAVISQ